MRLQQLQQKQFKQELLVFFACLDFIIHHGELLDNVPKAPALKKASPARSPASP